MQLGVKWSSISHAAFDLIDVQEVAGWSLDESDIPERGLLHNIDLDFSLARPGIALQQWVDRVNAAIAQTGSPWFSIHLGFSAEEVYFDDHMHPASDVLSREVTLQRSVEHLRYLKAASDEPLLIENLDYCPEGAYEHICEPAFISDVCNEVDCGLLLDLAHAQVSADWLGIEIRNYLNQLPLERVVEVHLSSPRRVGERLDDCHMDLTPHDYQLMRYLLDNSQPEAVILEYIRDAKRLREQVVRVRSLINECIR